MAITDRRRKTDAVLFDVGGTLVSYYSRAEFPAILGQCVGEVRDFLRGRHLLRLDPEAVAERVAWENHEEPTFRVRPLEERLIRIFDIDDLVQPPELIHEMCVHFMKPIFSLAKVYDDVPPVLASLRAEGLKLGLVSNTPWGSPAELWRRELQRIGLAPCFDAQVFCRDVGWRKPARTIFESAIKALGTQPGRCLFVGDDPRWDFRGAQSAGMEAILLDRTGEHPAGMSVIRGLKGLWQKIRLSD